MGKMKNLMIDKMNETRNSLDDTDWDAPEPIAVQSDGKKCWEIKSIIEDVTYRIWAYSYKEALEILPRIESL